MCVCVWFPPGTMQTQLGVVPPVERLEMGPAEWDRCDPWQLLCTQEVHSWRTHSILCPKGHLWGREGSFSLTTIARPKQSPT